jgi:hypothetical protein
VNSLGLHKAEGLMGLAWPNGQHGTGVVTVRWLDAVACRLAVLRWPDRRSVSMASTRAVRGWCSATHTGRGLSRWPDISEVVDGCSTTVLDGGESAAVVDGDGDDVLQHGGVEGEVRRCCNAYGIGLSNHRAITSKEGPGPG